MPTRNDSQNLSIRYSLIMNDYQILFSRDTAPVNNSQNLATRDCACDIDSKILSKVVFRTNKTLQILSLIGRSRTR